MSVVPALGALDVAVQVGVGVGCGGCGRLRVGAEVARGFALLGGTMAECLERGFARRVAVEGSRGMPSVTEQEGVVGWWGVAAGSWGQARGWPSSLPSSGWGCRRGREVGGGRCRTEDRRRSRSEARAPPCGSFGPSTASSCGASLPQTYSRWRCGRPSPGPRCRRYRRPRGAGTVDMWWCAWPGDSCGPGRSDGRGKTPTYSRGM